MLQGVAVAKNTDGRRGTGLHGDERGLVGEEAMRILAEGLETFLQTLAHKRGHPEMERTADKARGITALGKVVAQTVVHKVGHALGRCRLLHIALLPALLLHDLLEMHHRER